MVQKAIPLTRNLQCSYESNKLKSSFAEEENAIIYTYTIMLCNDQYIGKTVQLVGMLSFSQF